MSSSCCSIIDANSSVMGMDPFGRVVRGVSGFLGKIAVPVIADTKTDNNLLV